MPLFVLDDAILGTAHATPNRLGFLLESLHDLDGALRERGGHLVVRRGDWVGSVLEVAKRVRCRPVFTSPATSVASRSGGSRDLEEPRAGTRDVEVDRARLRDGRTTRRARVVERRPVPRVHAVLQALAHAAVALDACDPAVVDACPHGHRPRRDPEARALTRGRRAPDVVPGGESEGIKRSTRVDERTTRNVQGGPRRSRPATARRASRRTCTSVACRHWRSRTRLRDRPGW